MACDGLSGNGSFVRVTIDGVEALGDRNSSPTFNRATIESNSKSEPIYNCVIPDRIDIPWSFELKVKQDAEDAFYSAVEDHLFAGTTGTVSWGPFNNTTYVAQVLFTGITPAVAQGTLITTSVTGTTVGAVSRTRLP